MAKKKKRSQELKPWCWYCDRSFDDEKVLIDHQRAKHLKCTVCHKKMNTAGGLVVHAMQVHKEQLRKLENTLPGRDSVEIEIFGMEGIPEADLQKHIEEVQGGSAPKRFHLEQMDPDALKQQLAAFQAQKEQFSAAASSAANASFPPAFPGMAPPPFPVPLPGAPPFGFPPAMPPGFPPAMPPGFPPAGFPPTMPGFPPPTGMPPGFGFPAASAPPGFPPAPIPSAGGPPPAMQPAVDGSQQSYPPYHVPPEAPASGNPTPKLHASLPPRPSGSPPSVQYDDAVAASATDAYHATSTQDELSHEEYGKYISGRLVGSAFLIYADNEESIEEKRARMPRYAVKAS